MVEYYAHWERELYNALTQLIIRAMQNLMRLLSVKVPGQKSVSKKPLFKIHAIVRYPVCFSCHVCE
jgi:hypothetical protein